MTEQAVFVHRLHPAVRQLDRLIRWAQNFPEFPAVEWRGQAIRQSLVGAKLRPYVRTGKRAKQRRLIP